jgi:hypothetical protein
MLLAALLASTAVTALAESAPDAAEIMARVARNQDRAVEQRKTFVYHQNARVRLLKTNGKLIWDETREYDVAPTATGTEAKLLRTYGQRRKGRDFVPFDQEEELGIDGLDPELVDSFHDDLTGQSKGRDGLSPDLFPLISAEQRKYRFTLEGEEKYRGRQAYRVRFEPLADSEGGGEGIWKGEVLVDRDEFQPMFVATRLALNIPLAIRVIFGISIRQIGFSVNYHRFGENVWFPVSYGGEFFLKVLHFYKRTVIVSMKSDNFRHTAVDSDIRFEEPVSPTRRARSHPLTAGC